ncbi:MAG: hypothetical protein QOG20_6344, partial [Pseudonocardiales bacterium]|nr:hypothetical protein [Pseudonocardiales bacterium]
YWLTDCLVVDGPSERWTRARNDGIEAWALV